MSTVFRTWLASAALCFSALVLTVDADPQFLAARAMLVMLVVFLHAWVLAVTERACPTRGGVSIPRFALGPRLLSIRPGLISQCLVPVMILGLVMRSTAVLGFGVAAVLVLTTDALRRSLIWVIPATSLVMALLTMNEFHVLGDLLTSARQWVSVGLTAGVWVLIVAGPLLRTDVASIKPKGQLIALVASAPGYLGAFYVMTQTGFAGTQPGLMGVAVVLLAGGVVQSVVLGLFAQVAQIGPRVATEFPRVQARAIGMGVMPMLLCVTALMGLVIVSVGERGDAAAARRVWAALMALCMLIPLVPAAALVASGLDRVEGRGGSRRNRALALGCLAAWFVAGPSVLSWMYAVSGPMAQLNEVFTPVGGLRPIAAGSGATSFVLGTRLGGDLSLFGLPVADICRATTLMVASVALLSTQLLRHAACGLKGSGWGLITTGLALQALGITFLQPHIGPTGAALITAASALLVLLIDARVGEKVEAVEEPVCEFDGFSESPSNAEGVEDEPETIRELGLSMEFVSGVVPEPKPVAVEGGSDEAWGRAQLPDPRDDQPAPHAASSGDDFVIDELPDDPFFSKLDPTLNQGPPAEFEGGSPAEDDSEPTEVRL